MPLFAELRAARIAQGRTIRDTALAAGVHENTLQRAEREEAATASTLAAVAAVLGYRVVLVSQDADISSAKKGA